MCMYMHIYFFIYLHIHIYVYVYIYIYIYISTCLTAIPATVPYSQAAQPHNTTSMRKNARMELQTGIVFVFLSFWDAFFYASKMRSQAFFCQFGLHFGSILGPFWLHFGSPGGVRHASRCPGSTWSRF